MTLWIIIFSPLTTGLWYSTTSSHFKHWSTRSRGWTRCNQKCSNIYESNVFWTVIEGNIVLAIENFESNDKFWKVWSAIFIDQGYNDTLKASFVHYISVTRQHFTLLIVCLPAKLEFRLFLVVAIPGYLKSSKSLQCKVFVKPCELFCFSSSKILKKQKQL